MKITIDKAVLEMALAALKKCDSALSEELAAWDIDPPLHHVLEASNACGPSIAAMQEALAQPQQEPMPWKHDCAALLINGVELWVDHCPHCGKPRTSPSAQQEPVGEVTDAVGDAFKCEFKGPLSVGTYLYTFPPARKPLTDEQIYMHCPNWLSQEQCRAWVRRIEAAHGIKGTP